MWRNWTPYTLPVGMKEGTVVSENCVAVENVKHQVTIYLAIINTCSQLYYSYIVQHIYNSQKVETLQKSNKPQMDKKMIYLCAVISLAINWCSMLLHRAVLKILC